jgi:glycosyltransferase involved in cell wall biosynthesis
MGNFKITFNTTARPAGFDYARSLHALDALECFVTAFPKRQSRDLAAQLGSKAIFCDTWQLAFLLTNRLGGSTRVSRLLSHIAKTKLDACTVAHLGAAKAAVFYSGAGLCTVRACRSKGILSVSQVHHAHVIGQAEVLRAEAAASGVPYTPIYDPRQVRRQLREFEEVDVILCPSNAVRESFVSAGLPETKLIVVPHGVDLRADETAPDRGRTSGEPLRVLYVGQLHYLKGLRYLARAVHAMGLDNANGRLVGPDFGLSGLAGLSEAQCLLKTGAKKGEDLLKEYREADVFVLPSVIEGFGLVVLEAMRAGLPVIITSAVGAKDFVTDGIEGWIVPPGDTGALKDRLRWMHQNPAERQAMGRAASRRAREAGGWDASAKRLIQALEERASPLLPQAA